MLQAAGFAGYRIARRGVLPGRLPRQHSRRWHRKVDPQSNSKEYIRQAGLSHHENGMAFIIDKKTGFPDEREARILLLLFHRLGVNEMERMTSQT
jgi:hypothetical protein